MLRRVGDGAVGVCLAVVIVVHGAVVSFVVARWAWRVWRGIGEMKVRWWGCAWLFILMVVVGAVFGSDRVDGC